MRVDSFRIPLTVTVAFWLFTAAAPLLVAAQPAEPDTACIPTTSNDCRPTMSATIYLGEAIDTFAGDETLRYLNPNASGTREQREVGGVDFAYRLTRKGANRQLWVFGQTVHGVRSKDIDCSKESNRHLSVCTENGYDPEDPQHRFVYMLRNASSIEAFLGFRYELLPLNLGSDDDSPATVYVKAQAGFLNVAGGGGDVVDEHHIGLGVLSTSGIFAGSYVEAAWGRNDLFLRNRSQRAIIDGYLSFNPGVLIGRPDKDYRVRPFVQLYSDVDFGPGSDAIQTFFGLDFEIAR